LAAKVKDGDINYAINDRLGSTRAFVDSEGEKVAEFKSLPFGQEVINEGDDDIRYSFTGKEKDDTGLHYFAARYYDSNIGRFTTTDPVTSNHPYSYVANNPMNMIDPSGMDNILVIAADFKNGGDWNGAFSDFESEMMELEGQGHTVDYNTVGSGKEFVFAVLDAYYKFKETGEQYDLYIGGAHGSPGSLHLGNGGLSFSEDSNNLLIDIRGRDSQPISVREMFSSDARGVQSACSGACSDSLEGHLSIGKGLANLFGISIEASPGIYGTKLSDDLHMKIIKDLYELLPGVDEDGEGLFYISGDDVKVIQVSSSVTPFESSMYKFLENPTGPSFPIDSQEIYNDANRYSPPEVMHPSASNSNFGFF